MSEMNISIPGGTLTIMWTPDASNDANVGQKMVTGIERLYGFQNRVISGLPNKVVFSGDSTTYGSGGASGNDLDKIFGKTVARHNLPMVTTVNLGKTGNHTGQLLDTHLPEIVSQAPNLIVLRWGANDPFYGRSATQFDADLRASLASLRATFPLSDGVGIVVMAPSTMSDTPNGRDAAWFTVASEICRSAAESYKCAFIDTYELVRDSESAAGLWMDNPFSDGRAIHPLVSMETIVASAIFEATYPVSLRAIAPATVRKTALSLQNGWAPFDPTTSDPIFWKSNGVVHVSGIIKGGATAYSTVIATLPAGFRPVKSEYFSLLTSAPSSAEMGSVSVMANGEVRCFHNCNSGFLSLSGITFLAA